MALFVLVACRSSKRDPGLVGMKWILESVDGQKVEMKVAGNEIIMQFNDGEKRVTGMAGCNRFFGGYEADGNKLKFSHMGATRMTCPDQETEPVSSGFLKIRMLSASGTGNCLCCKRAKSLRFLRENLWKNNRIPAWRGVPDFLGGKRCASRSLLNI